MRLAWLLLAACGGTPQKPIENAAPAATDYRVRGSVVEDLQPPLARQYYKVGIENDRAYLVPRPDEELAANCKEDKGLVAIVRRYKLCEVPVSEAAFAERINSLSIADALVVKRTLERQLVFKVTKDPIDAWPPAPEHAVRELCARPDRSGLSTELCFYYSPEHRTLEARYFPDEAALLVARLNELYGIKP